MIKQIKAYAMNKATPEITSSYNPDFIEPAVTKHDHDEIVKKLIEALKFISSQTSIQGDTLEKVLIIENRMSKAAYHALKEIGEL